MSDNQNAANIFAYLDSKVDAMVIAATERIMARKAAMSDQPPDISEELARFNRERARLLNDKPVAPGERMPLPYSGVGGDVPEEA